MAQTSLDRPKIAHSLALAMVEASDAPLLLLHQDLCIIAASASFYRVYGIEPTALEGRQLFELGRGEWDVPQLRALLKGTASGQVAIDEYEMELKRNGRPGLCVVLKAQRLNFSDAGEVRLLVTVVDITAARKNEKDKERLVQEKTILLHELQHRVANSLQIIASVLLQSARKTASEETKLHLTDAHHRVMSVAAVQQQLATSQLGDVELRPYLVQLCASIAASMIDDPERITLNVIAEETIVSAEVSVSLGLIVTELVINALKHAYPGDRGGHIVVSYRARGPNWALLVDDDGVGMPSGQVKAKPGLGTSIVEALARQLSAKVQVADNGPGTAVRVVHTQIAAVADLPEAVAV